MKLAHVAYGIIETPGEKQRDQQIKPLSSTTHKKRSHSYHLGFQFEGALVLNRF